MARRKRLPKRIRIARCRCEICGLEDRSIIQAHHIIPVSEGGLDTETNVTRLCPNCHSLVHEGYFYNLQRYYTTKGWILFFEGGSNPRRFPSA